MAVFLRQLRSPTLSALLACLFVLLAWLPSVAQDIPPGTILPVRLNNSLKSNKSHFGQLISARVMQDVPLSPHSKVPAGAKVLGRIIEARPANGNAPAEMTIRFDVIAWGGHKERIVTNLRALATMMDVEEAQIPDTGPDRGTPEEFWVTNQIGGEVNYHGGGAVTHGSYVVGHSVPDGVLVRMSSPPGSECRSEKD